MDNKENRAEEFFEILIKNQVTMEVAPLEDQKSYVEPDDDYDFHAYRILLLIRVCGLINRPFFSNYTIYGRGKFSFYDFLIRYPFYLKRIIEKQKKEQLMEDLKLREYETERALSPMIKYIRGPWDPRYDAILNYMVSKKIIKVHFSNFNKSKKAMCLTLTELGAEISEQIKERETDWVNRMEIINSVFTKKATNERIENYIKKNFPSLMLGIEGE
ncbi:ABC-three component system middle component 4 [Priestia filamentosa]|uniref:ABC-three component system middle component 4 n=1 Tax=Priestia filamentosa TaxID=1402861 RepID=UPI000A085021|nr:ABC-three component system middle component 4 [Priestia filamentosa]OXS72072.1 hypothetical protein B1B01_07070 [Priestia filamentosa]SMF18465.1 hypothetical protein SAMN06296056_1011447 [Priestia filamentosa]